MRQVQSVCHFEPALRGRRSREISFRVFLSFDLKTKSLDLPDTTTSPFGYSLPRPARRAPCKEESLNIKKTPILFKEGVRHLTDGVVDKLKSNPPT